MRAFGGGDQIAAKNETCGLVYLRNGGCVVICSFVASPITAPEADMCAVRLLEDLFYSPLTTNHHKTAKILHMFLDSNA